MARPKTIAKSLAIGTPADGYYAIHTMRDTGGAAEDATDEEIIEGIKLLAECEGIFAETAGGVTVACAKKLVESGKIRPDESTVLCITGHGLKTAEAVADHCGAPRVINPSLREFEQLVRDEISRRLLIPDFTSHAHQHPHPHPAPETHRRPRTRAGRAARRSGTSSNRSIPIIPGLKERICDESGNVRRFVNVYLNDEDIRFLEETPRRSRTATRSASSRRLPGVSTRRGKFFGALGWESMNRSLLLACILLLAAFSTSYAGKQDFLLVNKTGVDIQEVLRRPAQQRGMGRGRDGQGHARQRQVGEDQLRAPEQGQGLGPESRR